MDFKLNSYFKPTGDQPKAIDELTKGVLRGDRFQTLLGVTGSGKTFSMANLIRNVGMPALVISHNKTLAAQLYGEFKAFFPDNAVEFFISYYDYYQPEAYLPVSDTYIEKDTHLNEEIERLRLKATNSILERKDVVVIASVSCIYGLGSPEDYIGLHMVLNKKQTTSRESILGKLIDIHYTRNDIDFHRGTFRVRGDVIEIFPSYENNPYRIEMWGNEVEKLTRIHPVTGETLNELDTIFVYPATHFVISQSKIENSITAIKKEAAERLDELKRMNNLVEAQRLEQRTNYDIEMLQEIGYCNGIENYSRHLTGRKEGEKPYTLLDYFQNEFLIIIDESHATLPQVRGMYNGDRSRKEVLVDYGFRLPSALDNRPLRFEEFETFLKHAVFVSATPGDYELEKSGGVIVEQIIRPTGLLDPEIEIRPVDGQIDDLIDEIKIVTEKQERILVTTLTKRMSEDLTEYLRGMDIRVQYLHSEIDALDRVEILRSLRLGEFDVLVGINLLREGLDLPEVSLVAILDADKEGFLRSERSLMQTAGRAARNVAGRVIFYADSITKSMKKTIDESNRRRKIQLAYNKKHGITPKSIIKSIEEIKLTTAVADEKGKPAEPEKFKADLFIDMSPDKLIKILEQEMMKAARGLEFERAAELRDEIKKLKKAVF
ncbi:excinuclease ABC subunit UvrB [candidate division KSB1 bacterium]